MEFRRLREADMARIMKGFFATVFAGLAIGASAATPEDDLQRYIAVFEDDLGNHDKAVDDLAWKGISDTRLFDIIEDRLHEDAQTARRRNKRDRNHVARMIKALGFSGQSKYEPSISRYASDRAYRSHAERALSNLRLYAKWNPVIADRSTWEPAYSDDVNRVRNMLSSNDIGLQTLGAKRVHFGHPAEPVLLDLVSQRLLECYKTVADAEGVEAAGWMVNGLGKAGDQKYRVVLKEVADGAASDKLRSRAAKALDR
jgi:hypothetical protein